MAALGIRESRRHRREDSSVAENVIYWCRFCGDRAVAIYSVPEGCQCYPEDREQALCPQHVISANPIGSMEIVTDLTGGAWSKLMEANY